MAKDILAVSASESDIDLDVGEASCQTVISHEEPPSLRDILAGSRVLAANAKNGVARRADNYRKGVRKRQSDGKKN